MSDLTPPPDEPLPDRSRARIRGELLRAAQDGATSRSRWVAPAVAAAAVVLVAGAGAWAVQGGGGTEGSPAAPGTSVAPSPPLIPEPGITPPDIVTGTPNPPPSTQQAGRGDCERELRDVLPGAELAAAFDDRTSFWVRGDQFVLCDVRGLTTVHRPLPMTPVEGVETYRVSSKYVPAGRGAFDVVRVAGGVVPDGAMAYDVEYTFPDGRTVPAETTTGEDGRTWWRVAHTYRSDGNEMKDPPITAQVSYSGVRHTYRLDWGSDTCAQANHGC
ncbi:hypothetical protein [Nocardioides sp. T2.26MG-1]|uniref:hypothetical protein n=1 Tax=Nocardioides sp. T2.26MG-1 TaxID=3041166 RepID=UPI0024772F09|nr:hypothetical protein [Nocardioides sp. T2.26MG-1]CAI9419934.1 hypothetical protein HIDPHFAB_03942 [Nocardioides sp. T2.26MG-1]